MLGAARRAAVCCLDAVGVAVCTVVVFVLAVGCVITVVGRGVRIRRGARNDGGCCVVVDVERLLL